MSRREDKRIKLHDDVSIKLNCSGETHQVLFLSSGQLVLENHRLADTKSNLQKNKFDDKYELCPCEALLTLWRRPLYTYDAWAVCDMWYGRICEFLAITSAERFPNGMYDLILRRVGVVLRDTERMQLLREQHKVRGNFMHLAMSGTYQEQFILKSMKTRATYRRFRDMRYGFQWTCVNRTKGVRLASIPLRLISEAVCGHYFGNKVDSSWNLYWSAAPKLRKQLEKKGQKNEETHRLLQRISYATRS